MLIMALVGVISTVVVTLLFILLAGAITRPINHLSKAALKLAEGDNDQSIAYRNTDEVGILADSFRQMIDYQKEMTHAVNGLERGDLTVQVKPRSAQDALGNALVHMIASFNGVINRVAESVDRLNSATGSLAEVANQTGKATSQIALTIQQLAQGNSQQASSINSTTLSVEKMTETINDIEKGIQEQTDSIQKASDVTTHITSAVKQVAGNAQTASHDSGESSRIARDGVNIIQETIRSMEKIKSTVGLSTRAVQEMGNRSVEINTIVETIDDIASQTNLLALNAAIEAARAGEHGKGFAVVADEVRKLAERSSSATHEIGALIKHIQTTIEEAVNAMGASTREVEMGVSHANDAGEALASIVKAAEAVYQQTNQVTESAEKMNIAANELVSTTDRVAAVIERNVSATQELSSGVNEVTKAMENIASISEENSAAAEEVSASTEEVSTQMDEVSNSVQALTEMADALHQIISGFKLKEG